MLIGASRIIISVSRNDPLQLVDAGEDDRIWFDRETERNAEQHRNEQTCRISLPAKAPTIVVGMMLSRKLTTVNCPAAADAFVMVLVALAESAAFPARSPTPGLHMFYEHESDEQADRADGLEQQQRLGSQAADSAQVVDARQAVNDGQKMIGASRIRRRQ